MEYKVGMYGGSFDPLHIGHIHDIIRAASMCQKLYIMISWCAGRESTSKELRYRWIHNSCKHLTNIKIIMVEDEAISKKDYNTDYYWEQGARDIKNIIGEPIDAVFCGTDYLGTNRFESLYSPESKVIYFDRKEIPISSTEIREWAFNNWEYIPIVCRSYYTKKVLVIGSESTGKSTLVQNLALAYNTNYLSEIGRDVCEYAGGEDLMIEDDFNEILIKHKSKELEAVKYSNRILFVDTDALTTKFYISFLKDNKFSKQLAESINNINNWDLVLFLEPTVKFFQDGTRNEVIARDREKYSNMIKDLFKSNKIPFYSIDGSYVERFNKSKSLINKEFNLSK